MITAILDLSSMFHRLWHVDRDNVEHRIMGFLKTRKEGNIIVAIDSPPYKRKEIYPEYKANRDVPEPELIGCLKNVKNKIYSEGFKIAYCEGAEADDVIASLIPNINGDVVVYGSDKDLLQCTDLTDIFTNKLSTPESKLGVTSEQVVDYLSLLGDKSDNIPGVKGVGEVNAKKLLETYGSMDVIIQMIEAGDEVGSAKITEAIKNSMPQLPLVKHLVTLDDTLELKYLQKIAKEEPEDVAVEYVKGDIERISMPITNEIQENEDETVEKLPAVKSNFNRSLEPIDLNQAYTVAKYFDKACLYQQFHSPEQILMVIMKGRDLGLGAMASMDLLEVIKGKICMKAAGMAGLIKSRNDVCEYLMCTYMGKDKAVWETKRVGNPKPTVAAFTYDEADDMVLLGRDNWKKQPAVMLQWRCLARLARQEYPDVILGIYAKEEFE